MARSAIGRRQNIFLHNVNLMFFFNEADEDD